MMGICVSGCLGKDIQMNERKYARLTLAERRSIEQGLKAGESIRHIAFLLNRSASTVSREILRNSIHEKTGGHGTDFNDCLSRGVCDKERLCQESDCSRGYCCGCRLCFHVCRDYAKERCPDLERPPYVCNGCRGRRRCTLEKAFYRAAKANRSAEAVLREKRTGIDLTKEELERLDRIVSPLIKQGQSPWHICECKKDELMICDKTLYNYIAMGLFGATSTDLRVKVKMKPRKTKRGVKVDRGCRTGRMFDDFKAFAYDTPDIEVPQMDTVIGAKGRGEKCLLTICFPKSELLLAFLRDANTAASVTDVMGRLKELLGYETFTTLFGAILTDNGSEFSDPQSIERDDDGVIWTKVYYCEPYSSWQKPHIENSHRLLRCIFPKSKSLNGFTQKDIYLALCHINSYRRRSFGGQSPIRVFENMYGTEVLKKLGIALIQPDEITLKPSIFKNYI
jgi:IS30 family transposase